MSDKSKGFKNKKTLEDIINEINGSHFENKEVGAESADDEEEITADTDEEQESGGEEADSLPDNSDNDIDTDTKEDEDKKAEEILELVQNLKHLDNARREEEEDTEEKEAAEKKSRPKNNTHRQRQSSPNGQRRQAPKNPQGKNNQNRQQQLKAQQLKAQQNSKRRPNSGERAHIKGTGGGKRPKKPTPEEIRAARRREKLKKRLKNTIFLLVIILFALIVYVTRSIWVPKLEGVLDRPAETVVNDGEVKKGNYPIKLGAGYVRGLQSSGSNLLTLDKNSLRIYNEDGSVLKAYNHNYADPVLKSAQKRMLIYDKGGSALMVVNKQSEMYAKTISNKIIMAEIANNNNIAVVTKDERYAGILYIFDPNGREIFKWSSNTSLLSVTFTEDGNGCYVTTYAGKGGELRSTVRYFRFDSDTELVKSVDLPILALKAYENDNGGFWVAGDTAFIRLDSAGNMIMQYDYPSTLVDYDLSGGCAALVFNNVVRKSSQLVLFESDSNSGGPDSVINNTDGSPIKLHISSSKVVLLKDKQVACYSFSGNLVATAELGHVYNDFVYFGDNIYFEDYQEINKIEFSTKA